MKPSTRLSSRLILTLTVGSLLALAMPVIAYASHPRPKAATPVTDKLVPAFDACVATNAIHGVPLALPSCVPPTQTSNFLTVVAPDRAPPFNLVPDFAGTVIERLSCHVVPIGNPPVLGAPASPPCAAGDAVDIRITAALAKVRCVGVSGGCAAAAALYTGKVLLQKTLKISDHSHALVPNPPGPDCSDNVSCPGTLIDFPVQWGSQCAAGDCSFISSFNALVTNVIPAGKRMVIAENPDYVYDAGADGDLAAAGPPTTGVCPPACAQNADGEKLFLEEGTFAP